MAPPDYETRHKAAAIASAKKEAAEEPMKRIWTIIGVADVPRSFKWYQSLLGLAETAPAHDDFGQIVDSDGTLELRSSHSEIRTGITSR